MFKPANIIFCAFLLLLAGCATAPQPAEETPAATGMATNAVSHLPAWRAPILPPATNAPPGGQINAPPVRITRPAPLLAWTSLNRWTAQVKLSPPHLVATTPITAYALNSPNGVLTLVLGSRDALWNGVELHLGFAPEIIDGQLFVYGVDLQKNLAPLLTRPPLGFGPRRTIVIDPGHGGINGGTVSVLDKRPEKEFTLDWACRLKPLLEAEGWRVFLTRTNDVDVALSNRVACAELHHADVFVSLHFNSAAPSRRESGLETYCLTPVGLPSTLTRDYPDVISQTYPNNDADEANVQLAVGLQAALVHGTGEVDRGVRRARFMGVLQGQRRPAVLIEGGFLSNPAEAQRIESAAGRQHLAEILAHALR